MKSKLTNGLSLFISLLILTIFSTNLESDAWAAKKAKPARLKVSAFASSVKGTLQLQLTNAGKKTIKRVKPGAVRFFNFPKGTKVELLAKPKSGFKAGLIVNGNLVRFQNDKGKSQKLSARVAKKAKITELKYSLPKLTISASAVPVIEARFVAKGESFTKNAGITFSGLGGAIKVTNQGSVNLTGKAESDVGVSSVSLQNLTTNTAGAVTGTKSWASPVTFAQGDNRITVTMRAKDGSTFSNSTVITFYPGIDFVTPLHVSNDVLFLGSAGDLTFNIGLAGPSGASVSLVETDQNGAELASTPSDLVDTGALPDEIDQDGLFTGQRTVDTAVLGFKYFRAKVIKPSATYFSEVVSIWITNPFTSSQVRAALDLANNVQARFDALRASGQSEAQAVATILAEIQHLPSVGAAGVSDGNAIWWMTQDGILGGFQPFRGTERGDGGRAGSGRNYNELIRSLQGQATNPALVSFYTPRELDYVVSDSRLSSFPTLAAQSEDPNRVKSYKALLVSPFINNPNSSANFGNTDDFFGPWQVLISKGSICSEKADKFVSNNGSIGVGLADFENLSDFGVVHFSTHGNNFYNGLLSLWKDVWGKKLSSLQAYFSIVGLNSGVYLPVAADGTIDSSSVATDLAAHRIAIFPTGAIYLLPEFFEHYVGTLPRSIVLLSACRSTYNNSLADVFLGKGAGAVFGFTDYVSSTYAQNTTKQIYTRLLENDDTVLDAFNSAVTQFGTNDADADPAYLTLAGNNDLKRHSGGLANAGFEDGTLTPWQTNGDGRLIGQLGSFTPTEGSFMGVVSTGLGYTTDSGTLSQNFCLQNQPSQVLQFAWNYSSEEFKEYCDSVYQDTFTVQMCEIDPATEAELSCNVLLHQTVDSLCSMVFGVGFSFDQGGVYSTGWLNATLPVPDSLAGKSTKIKFSAGDVGDSIYDTAVLIDDIRVGTPAPN